MEKYHMNLSRPANMEQDVAEFIEMTAEKNPTFTAADFRHEFEEMCGRKATLVEGNYFLKISHALRELKESLTTQTPSITPTPASFQRLVFNPPSRTALVPATTTASGSRPASALTSFSSTTSTSPSVSPSASPSASPSTFSSASFSSGLSCFCSPSASSTGHSDCSAKPKKEVEKERLVKEKTVGRDGIKDDEDDDGEYPEENEKVDGEVDEDSDLALQQVLMNSLRTEGNFWLDQIESTLAPPAESPSGSASPSYPLASCASHSSFSSPSSSSSSPSSSGFSSSRLTGPHSSSSHRSCGTCFLFVASVSILVVWIFG